MSKEGDDAILRPDEQRCARKDDKGKKNRGASSLIGAALLCSKSGRFSQSLNSKFNGQGVLLSIGLNCVLNNII